MDPAIRKTTGVRSDHTVILTAIDSAKAYPDSLRRVSYLDIETKKRLKFLTNNFVLPAFTIAVGRWNYFSNGSNSTFASKRSTAPARTP